MTGGELTLIGTLLAILVSVVTLLGGVVRLTWLVSERLKKINETLAEELKERDKRILRLEFWAVLQRNGFQPGMDVDDMHGVGNTPRK